MRKWYFATNTNGLVNAFDQISVAVQSAKQNTSLIPHCLVDTDSGDAVAGQLEWLRDQGVRLIPHRAGLLDILMPVFGERLAIFSGHWLRADIPQIETEDDYVLYTDIDVCFLKDPAVHAPRPSIMACGPEHHRGDYSYFNSGVMVMNVQAFGTHRHALEEGLRNRLQSTEPYDDQSLLNTVFQDRWDHLPDEWNWKPYWGFSPDAVILHWHGPKPEHVRHMAQSAVDDFLPDFRTIYSRHPEGYGAYLQVFDAFRADTGLV